MGATRHITSRDKQDLLMRLQLCFIHVFNADINGMKIEILMALSLLVCILSNNQINLIESLIVSKL